MAVVILAGSPSAQAIVVPGVPGSPSPSFPPGSSGWCYQVAGGSLSTPSSTVGAGSFVALTFHVDLPSQCGGSAHLYGPGGGGQIVDNDGTMTVNAPLALGSAAWQLSVNIGGQVPKVVASVDVAVIAPHQPAVAVARNADGRMEYVRAYSNGVVAHRSQTAAGSVAVSNWGSFDGALDNVVAATNSDGRVEVFGVSGQGNVWYRSQLVAGAGTWTDWKQLVSQQPATDQMLTVAVTRKSDGGLVLFGASSNGQLFRSDQGTANGSEFWTAWSAQATGPAFDALAAGTDADGTIELVGLEPNGNIWQRWSTAGGGWSAFTQIPGGLVSIAMARQADGRLTLYGTNVNNSIYENWQSSANGRNNWIGWQVGSGGLNSIAAAIAGPGGGVEIFGVYQTSYSHGFRLAVGAAWSWTPFDEAFGTPITAPTAAALQVTAHSVGTSFTDQSTNEVGFEVQRRGDDGQWTVANASPSRNVGGTGDQYTWNDMADISGQCYRYVAYTHDTFAAAPEQCTVRPDGGRFPPAVSRPAQQWSGFTGTNGGAGELHNTQENQDVVFESRTFGENLGWGDANVWTFEAEGGPTLMKGQALALRLGTHGYLHYSQRQFGVNLELSSTPSYEWYVVGGAGTSEDPQAGAPLGGSGALWNRTAQAYLVTGDETWGIDLKWYQVGDGSAPPVNNPPSTTFSGIKNVNVVNCDGEQHPLEVFLQDRTAGTAYADKGSIASAWTGGGCPGSNPPTLSFSGTVTGHQYVLVTTDRLSPFCASHLDDPLDSTCQRSVVTFTGDSTTSGHTLTDVVGIQAVVN